MVIINLSNYTWRIWFIYKTDTFNDTSEMWRRHQKLWKFFEISNFFRIFYVVPHSCKVSKPVLKASVRYFLFFHQMIGLPKVWKMPFISSKIFFRSRDIQIFVLPSSSPFLPVGHCFRVWSKINLKAYDTINCPNKNLITDFVWYVEKKKKYVIETLSIDRALNKEHFLWKNHAENVHQKLVPDPFFILVNKL